MYDTLAGNSLAGCRPCNSSSSLGNPYGLGACSSERDERHRREVYKNDLKNNKLPTLKKELESYKTGKQQKAFTQQETEINTLREKIGIKKIEKAQIEKIRDAWRDTPDLAAKDPTMAMAGLGSWFGRLVSRTFSCGHYENDIKNINYEITPLEKEKSKIEEELRILKEKMSPEKMDSMVKSKGFLKRDLEKIESEIATYRSEIQSYKKMRQTRLQAEQLAAQQAALEADKKRYQADAEARVNAEKARADERIKNEQRIYEAKITKNEELANSYKSQVEDLKNKPKEKDNTMTYVIGGAAFVLAMMFLRGGGNKTIIKSKA